LLKTPNAPIRSTLFIGVALAVVGSAYQVPVLTWGGVLALVVAIAGMLRSRVPILARASEFMVSTVSELKSCYWPSAGSVVESVKFVVWSVLVLSAYLFVVDLSTTELLSWAGISKVAVSTSQEDIQ